MQYKYFSFLQLIIIANCVEADKFQVPFQSSTPTQWYTIYSANHNVPGTYFAADSISMDAGSDIDMDRDDSFASRKALYVRGGNVVRDMCKTCSRESMFIGTILPFLKRLGRGGMYNQGHFEAGIDELKKDFNIEDAMIVSLITFCVEPSLRLTHNVVVNKVLRMQKDYERSAAKFIGTTLQELGQIGMLTYAVELAAAFVEGNVHTSLEISYACHIYSCLLIEYFRLL